MTKKGVPPGPNRRLRARLSGIRMKLLAWFFFALALTTVASVLVVRQILLDRLHQRIDQGMVREAAELRSLAQGRDPATGQPFGLHVARIFEVFLENNIASPDEVFITLVDGEPYLRSQQVLSYRLDQDRDLVDRWAKVTDTDRGSVQTSAGPVEYLAVPVVGEGAPSGVFVVATFLAVRLQEINTAVAGVAATGAAILLMGSILAWILADRILGPVRRMSQAARTISLSDLTRRIETGGRDELGELAATFNGMLERLEDAYRSQKQFFDDVGHELRTPITIVRGQLETTGTDPAEFEKVKALVMDELERVSRFIDDLLLLARAERVDFLNLDIVEVERLTREVFAKAESLGPRRWTLDGTGAGRIEADRQRLSQAVLELARNACKHTDEDQRITLGSEMADGEAVFWVSDSGPGIGPADTARIFSRFKRGSHAGHQDGSGLGLAIVKAIAEAHSGRVELDSRPDEGATFRLIVPVDQPVREEVSG